MYTTGKKDKASAYLNIQSISSQYEVIELSSRLYYEKKKPSPTSTPNLSLSFPTQDLPQPPAEGLLRQLQPDGGGEGQGIPRERRHKEVLRLRAGQNNKNGTFQYFF